MTVTASPTDLAVGPVTAIDMSEPLTQQQALQLTEHIRDAADVMYVLIARAHAGRVWDALGYPSWEAYVRAEFDMSRSRAYQLLDQAKIIASIEAAAPPGTRIELNEKAARDLKKVLGEVVEEVTDQTTGMTPEEASAAVDNILAQYRNADSIIDAGVGRGPFAVDDFGLEVPSTAVGSAGSLGLDAGAGVNAPRPPAPATVPKNVDAAARRRIIQACYDLYASVSALSVMPAATELIAAIPPERHSQVSETLNPAITWLEQFAVTWRQSENVVVGHTVPNADDNGEPDEDAGN